MAKLPSQPTVMSMLADLKRRVKDLETAATLTSSSIGSGGLVVREDGQIVSDDFQAGSSGYRLGGETLEINDLILRGGIIGNDALSNPVRAGWISSVQNNFGTTTTDLLYAPASVLVPDGFTTALVFINVYVGAVNSTSGFDYLYVQARIEGVDSREIPVLADGGDYRGAATAKSTLLTDLVAGTEIEVGAAAHSQNAPWEANPSNRSATEGIVLFLR